MQPLQNFLFAAMLAAIPLNGIAPLAPIGELSGEGFFYASLPYCVFSAFLLLRVRTVPLAYAKSLLRSQRTYVALILLSVILAFPTIASNSYGNRAGIERYVVSFATYAYYLCTFLLMAVHLARIGAHSMVILITSTFRIVGAILVVVCTIEILSWYSDALRSIWSTLRHAVSINPFFDRFRLYGLSYEPSFNAFAMLACIPWLVASPPSRWKTADRFLAILLLVLSAASGARTAYVGLLAMAAVYAVRRYRFARWPPSQVVGLLVLAAFAAGAIAPHVAVTHIGSDQSTSNITRSYLMSAAVEAGLSAPLGQGYGQTSFAVTQKVSSAVEYSWELVEFYQGDRYGELPPLYSWYGRSFGEFGAVGYVLLAISFSAAAGHIFRSGAAQTTPSGKAIYTIFALLLGQMLAVAFSIESVRVPQYWMPWLVGAILSAHVRVPAYRHRAQGDGEAARAQCRT